MRGKWGRLTIANAKITKGKNTVKNKTLKKTFKKGQTGSDRNGNAKIQKPIHIHTQRTDSKPFFFVPRLRSKVFLYLTLEDWHDGYRVIWTDGSPNEHQSQFQFRCFLCFSTAWPEITALAAAHAIILALVANFCLLLITISNKYENESRQAWYSSDKKGMRSNRGNIRLCCPNVANNKKELDTGIVKMMKLRFEVRSCETD